MRTPLRGFPAQCTLIVLGFHFTVSLFVHLFRDTKCFMVLLLSCCAALAVLALLLGVFVATNFFTDGEDGHEKHDNTTWKYGKGGGGGGTITATTVTNAIKTLATTPVVIVTPPTVPKTPKPPASTPKATPSVTTPTPLTTPPVPTTTKASPPSTPAKKPPTTTKPPPTTTKSPPTTTKPPQTTTKPPPTTLPAAVTTSERPGLRRYTTVCTVSYLDVGLSFPLDGQCDIIFYDSLLLRPEDTFMGTFTNAYLKPIFDAAKETNIAHNTELGMSVHAPAINDFSAEVKSDAGKKHYKDHWQHKIFHWGVLNIHHLIVKSNPDILKTALTVLKELKDIATAAGKNASMVVGVSCKAPVGCVKVAEYFK
ncbi:uncharacterized protein [Dermacentor albipictus]|uniref:uncharacterized protein n=1 Tax=Dermacentor albipictus TaxID=60249 RepID=UPI0038FC65FF